MVGKDECPMLFLGAHIRKNTVALRVSQSIPEHPRALGAPELSEHHMML